MKKEELENLSESDEKVRRMLASLKQVEAPKDFEFRLKARIAKTNPKAFQPAATNKRRFAYALPAFASIVVSAFVVLNGNFFGDANQPPVSSLPEAIATQSTFVPAQNSPAEEIASSETGSANTGNGGGRKETTERNSSTVLTAATATNSRIERDRNEESPLTADVANIPEKPKSDPRRESKKENESFSKDIAGRNAPKVFRPKGLNPDARVEAPKDFNSEKSFSVQELLSPLGVEVVAAENGKWKVKNVSANSAAERSGIKTDDVIETLDGKKLSGATRLRGKKIEVKKLGVKRGDAQVDINLQTSPK